MDSKNKATFIWLPLSSKERMVEFNLAYSSLKSKILQPIHNPTIIYIKILYIYNSKLGLHDIIINPYSKKLLLWTKKIQLQHATIWFQVDEPLSESLNYVHT
jgi:hypothetical protein